MAWLLIAIILLLNVDCINCVQPYFLLLCFRLVNFPILCCFTFILPSSVSITIFLSNLEHLFHRLYPAASD